MAKDCGETCKEHSGINTLLRVITGLSALGSGLLSYSVFWQAPNIKADIAKEVARLEREDMGIKSDLRDNRLEISALQTRVTKLEAKQ